MKRRYCHLAAAVTIYALSVVLSNPASAQITVASAEPNNAQQGTSALNVNIAGSGFAKGAKATWYVTGTTNTGSVTVISTTFVNSNQLVANITVPENATVSGYDILVTNTSGRTGVGSDLFTINPEAVTSSISTTDPTGASATVQGDGLVTNSSGNSIYENAPENCETFDPQNICIIESLLPNDWYLRLYSGSGRSVRLNFVALGNSPDESSLDGEYSTGTSVITRCFNANNNQVSIPLTVPAGTSNNRCSLRVDFTANGTSYLYIMSPIYAGTGWSTTACLSGTVTQTCNAWSITPTLASQLPNPNLANVANLYTVARSGKLKLVGTYQMTFSIKLTQP
jgi:hypothetical protein